MSKQKNLQQISGMGWSSNRFVLQSIYPDNEINFFYNKLRILYILWLLCNNMMIVDIFMCYWCFLCVIQSLNSLCTVWIFCQIRRCIAIFISDVWVCIGIQQYFNCIDMFVLSGVMYRGWTTVICCIHISTCFKECLNGFGVIKCYSYAKRCFIVQISCFYIGSFIDELLYGFCIGFFSNPKE